MQRVTREIPGSDEAVEYLRGQGFHVWWAGLDRTGRSFWAISDVKSINPGTDFRLYSSPEITDLARLDILAAEGTDS